MKEIKPLGSEKLTGDAKMKRILELTYWGDNQNKQTFDKPEFVTEANERGVYGIVKEKDGFYVKQGLTEGTLEYIGGMFMKNKNKFSSYGEAYKRLKFLQGQDNLQEATKYVLRQSKPSMEAAPVDPSLSEPPAPPVNNDIPPIPTGDEPSPEGEIPMGDESGMGAEGGAEGGGEEQNLRSGYMEAIQKWSGKLGQELRDQKEKMESDDIKYVLNMVISAIDLQKLDDEDMEEIADKFDREEEEFEDPEAEGNEFDVPEPDPEDAEVNETMGKLDDFINTSMDEDDDMFSEFSMGNEDSGEQQIGGNDEVIMHHDAQPELDRKPVQPRFRTNPVSEVSAVAPSPQVNTSAPRPQVNTAAAKPQVKEFDLDEITDKVNRMIKDNFSKYFN